MKIDFDITELRTQKGWSQNELARQSGLSSRQVKSIEAGDTKNPHPDTVRRLRDALCVETVSSPAFLKERAEYLKTLSSAILAQTPDVRFIEVRTEQVATNSYASVLENAYRETGDEIYPDGEEMGTVWETFNEHSGEYLHFVGSGDDSIFLDLESAETLMPVEFAMIQLTYGQRLEPEDEGRLYS